MAQTGSVLGRVSYQKEDSLLRVAFANILLKNASGNVIGGVVADDQGQFEVTNLPFGVFSLRIQSVGFEPLLIQNLSLSSNTPTLNLAELLLQESATALKEVTVTARKDEIEYDLDRKVFNVGDNPAYAGGSAVEVLQNVPSVNVSLDGSISLRGNSNLTVLVDGRPAAGSRQSVLEQIPANMIERIEFITSPSARYDADGSGGVINIITKKNKFVGYNGTLSSNLGTGNKYNLSANLNYRNKKLNWVANTDWRSQLFGQRQSVERNSTVTDRSGKITNYLLQQGSTGYTRTRNTTSKIGGDWYATPKQTLSWGLTARQQAPLSLDERLSSTYNLGLPGSAARLFGRNTERTNALDGYDWTVGYQRIYDNPKKKWTADGVLTIQNGHDAFGFLQRDYLGDFQTPSLFNPRLERSDNLDRSYVLTLQTDVDNSLGKKRKGKIEYGAKATLRHNDTDYAFLFYQYATSAYLRNEKRSNRFVYDEQVYAAYLSAAHPWKKWNVQAGLRAEWTGIGINQRTQRIERDTAYFTLFPNLLISRSLKKGHRAQINFARRINRPSYTALNPFINYSDSLNLQTGNPYLKPELVNAYELGYSYNHKEGFSLNSTLFYRQTLNSVVRTRQLLADNITQTTWQNLGSNSAYGLELVLVQPLAKWWKLNGNWSVFRVDLLSQTREGTFVRSRNSWTARLNSQMQFSKKVGLQLSGNYRSGIVTVQGTVAAIYSIDVGLRASILKNKGTLSLRLTDVMDTQKNRSLTEGLGFSTNSYTNRETRVAYVVLSYRFNKKLEPRAERRERKRINEERAGEN